jgi:hypothetical protein
MDTFKPIIGCENQNLDTNHVCLLSHYLRRHMEHGKLAKILERKGLKIVHNVKTQWISMIALAKHVLVEYNSLVVKMDDDFIGNAIANLEQL